MSRIRARLVDRHAPRWTWALAAAGALAVVVGFALDWGVVGWLGLATVLIAPLLRQHRRASRNVELELGHGRVRVRSLGAFGARIRGRKLSGASTAYLSDGRAFLTLRSRRTRTLELADAGAARAVRGALGIGHYGVGTLSFDTVPTRTMLAGQLFSAIGAIAALLAALDLQIAMTIALVSAVAALTCILAAHNGPRPRLELLGDGLLLRWPSRAIAYSAIADVSVGGDLLALTLEGGEIVLVPARARHLGVVQGLGDDELEIVRAQIASAVARAEGRGEAEPSIAPSLADLRADNGGVAAWLGKLDAMAARVAKSGGYRGAPLSEADLWEALENHDAEPEIRAAAARVLVQSKPETRARIAEIAASARDPETERRIRFALLSDPEDAERALTKIATG